MSDATWLPIRYRAFYDVPRMILVQYRDQLYLFDSPFDEQADDYDDKYSVYILPRSVGLEDEVADWGDLSRLGKFIGTVAVGRVKFDDSKRKSLDDEIFNLIA